MLPSLLKEFEMLRTILCYDKENHEECFLDNITIRYSNCRKKTGLSVKNTDYKDTVTKFAMNSVLHHVGLSWIFETNQKLEYNIDKIIHIRSHMVPGITHLFVQNYMEQCMKNILEM